MICFFDVILDQVFWLLNLSVTYLTNFFVGQDRILIFASDEQVDIIQDTEDFLVDGTFKVVPEIFYQLFIVHGVFRDHVVPLVYALLRRKNAETYQNLILEILKIAPRWSPRTIMLDFEQASIGAFESAFPNAALSVCYFHLRQSIHRKIQVSEIRWVINSKFYFLSSIKELGHQNTYQNDAIFSHKVHKIASLAFLEPNSVVTGFERLSMDLGDDLEDILDYFERTYIGT